VKKVVEKPTNQKVVEIWDEFSNREYTIQINGLCLVNYQGRAKSKLDKGERIVIKKQDSALLVHGPDGYQPKNWQPEVDKFSSEVKDNKVILTAKRNNPEEIVEITFSDIQLITVSQLIDKSDLQIRGHEVDIHEAIEERPQIVEEGLKVVEREKKTPAGYIDVFARDKDNNYVVIEVKRNPDYNSIIQLNRYVEEIDEEFKSDVRGILVAPKITDNVLEYLNDRDLGYQEVEMQEIIPSHDGFRKSQKGLSDFQDKN